jgi:DNA-binding transcriptional regulator YiaG
MTVRQLRDLLKKHRVSQVGLARMLGVAPRTVRHWVRRGRPEPVPTMVEYAIRYALNLRKASS